MGQILTIGESRDAEMVTSTAFRGCERVRGEACTGCKVDAESILDSRMLLELDNRLKETRQNSTRIYLLGSHA